MPDQSGRDGKAADPVQEPPSAQADVAAAWRERWTRLRRSLWQPPRPHGEQPRERVVGPLELFYDLAVVVLVAQAARHLAGDLTWSRLGEFAAIFTLVWIAWTNGTLHHELHGHDDARARSTFLLQILILAVMGAFIPEAGKSRGAPFAVSAAVLFAILAVLWLLAGRGDRPEFRRPSRLFVIMTAACAALLAGTAFLPAAGRVLGWGVIDAANLAGFVTVYLIVPGGAAAVLTITDALIERFGLLIIIVLGEILTGVVGGLASQPVSAITITVGLVAVVVGFGAWWTYFDFAGHRPLLEGQAAELRWMFSHLPLTAAVAAMGAAMVSLIDHARDGHTPAATAWVLSAGAAIVLCMTMLISTSLRAWREDPRLYRPLARICVAVALACLGLGAWRPAPLLLGLALVVLLSIPWVFAVAQRLAAGADLSASGPAASSRFAGKAPPEIPADTAAGEMPALVPGGSLPSPT